MVDATGTVSFEDCYATWTHDILVIGNSLVEQRWRMGGNGLASESLFDKLLGYQWIATPKPCEAHAASSADVVVTFDVAKNSVVSATSLNLSVLIAMSGTTRTFGLSIYPEIPAIISRPSGTPIHAPGCAEIATSDAATGIEAAPIEVCGSADGDSIDAFELHATHLRLRHAALVDQTDIHNELVIETEYRLHSSEANLTLQGNVFCVEDVIDGAALTFVKLAPLPHTRPIKEPHDFQVRHGKHVRFYGDRYRWVTLVSSGGQHGVTSALQRLQNSLRQVVAGRDGQFLSNTWGDRGRDSRICESFMLIEIEAASRLGVDVVQIDDGWQAGKSANSALATGGVWEGFNALDGFWSIDEAKFPGGFPRISEFATAHGVRLGLWFAPDSTDDFAHWQTDADRLLSIHEKHGVDYFKLDGIKVRTVDGEANLHRFMEAVREKSYGRIVCDLDVTAETRPGYFGAVEAGPVFVENRYTDFHNYWPHATLRNIWKLARYMPPVRLRAEILNIYRNAQFYANDRLAPSCYDPAFVFATVMLASPLGWFEVSELPQSYFEAAAPLVEIWKEHRTRLHAADVFPIGETPDGTSWTGFLVRPYDGGDGYLVAFREMNDRSTYEFDLSGLISAQSATVLSGSERVEIANGAGIVSSDRPLSYVFAKLRQTSD